MRSPYFSSLSDNPRRSNLLNFRFMHRLGLLGWLLLLGLGLGLLPSTALAGNHTIDDSDNTITYSAGWNIGNTCSGCFANPPDRTSIYGQTWHDTTRGNSSTAVISMEYSFTGIAVYVYGIIVNIVETNFLFTTNNDLVFFIDGTQAGTFVHQPANTNSYDYGVQVFAKDGLANTAHTLRVELNPNSMFLFDDLVYQTPDSTTTTSASSTSSDSSTTLVSTSSSLSRSSPFSATSSIGFPTLTNDPFGTAGSSSASGTNTSSSSSNKLATGAIAGIAVGGVFFLALLALLAFFLIRRTQKRNNLARPGMLTYQGGSTNEPLVHGYGPGGPGGGNAQYMSMANPSNPNMNAYMAPSMFTAHDVGNSGGHPGAAPFAGATFAAGAAGAAIGNNNSGRPNGNDGSFVAASPENLANSTMNSKQRMLQEQSQGYQAQAQSREDFQPPVPAWAQNAGRESSVGSGTVVTDLESSNESPQSGPYAGGGQSFHPYSGQHPAQYPGMVNRPGVWNSQASLYPHGVPPAARVGNLPGPESVSGGYTESAYSGLDSSQSGGDGMSSVGGGGRGVGVLGIPAQPIGMPGAIALQRHESAFTSRPGTAPPPYQIPASPPPLSPESRLLPPPREKR